MACAPEDNAVQGDYVCPGAVPGSEAAPGIDGFVAQAPGDAADADGSDGSDGALPLDAELPDDLNAAALEIVARYAKAHLDKSDPDEPFRVYVVWQCHILGHRKWLISTTLRDGMYYEVTYNSARMEFYLDAYKKFENVLIPGKRLYA